MIEENTDRRRAIRIAAVQGAVLTALCLLAFRAQIAAIFNFAIRDRESAHLLAAPILVALLVYLRRDTLAKAFTGPNLWGLGVVTAAILVHTMFRWPFNYGYPHRIAIVLAITGVVLTVGGWRVLVVSLPMLAILLFAIPITPRHYARLIIVPETLTLEAVRGTLDLLPGVLVELDGSDLSYFKAGDGGTIALGEPYRGASLFLAYLTIGIFVTGARIRPLWHTLGLAAAAIPIMLVCNYARLLLWGLITIWNGAGPLDAAPRFVSTSLSLLLAYGLFGGTAVCLSRMLTSTIPGDADHATNENQHG